MARRGWFDFSKLTDKIVDAANNAMQPVKPAPEPIDVGFPVVPDLSGVPVGNIGFDWNTGLTVDPTINIDLSGLEPGWTATPGLDLSVLNPPIPEPVVTPSPQFDPMWDAETEMYDPRTLGPAPAPAPPIRPVPSDLIKPDKEQIHSQYAEAANDIVPINDAVSNPIYAGSEFDNPYMLGFTDSMGTQIQTNVNPVNEDNGLMTLEEFNEANNDLLSPQAQALNAINTNLQSSQTVGDVTTHPPQIAGKPAIGDPNPPMWAQIGTAQGYDDWLSKEQGTLNQEAIDNRGGAFWTPESQFLDARNVHYNVAVDNFNRAMDTYLNQRSEKLPAINDWNHDVDSWVNLQSQMAEDPNAEYYQNFGEVYTYDPNEKVFNSMNTDNQIFIPDKYGAPAPMDSAPIFDEYIDGINKTIQIANPHYTPPNDYENDDDGGGGE